MLLLVFRHGIAEDISPSGDDFNRRLTQRGVEKTATAARGLARLCEPPDLILTSPKVRAQQTAQIAGDVFDRPIETLDVIAHGSSHDIRDALLNRTEHSLMIVGHEPTLSGLIELLLTDRPMHGGLLLKKAGAALIDAGLGPQRRGEPGILHWLMPPRALRALVGKD